MHDGCLRTVRQMDSADEAAMRTDRSIFAAGITLVLLGVGAVATAIFRELLPSRRRHPTTREAAAQ